MIHHGALSRRADVLATYAIFPYNCNRRGEEPDNTIFYDYQGEGWFYATLPLALAYQMTADPQYANKLLQLADELIRAQSDPDNGTTCGPLQVDNYYPTRYLPVLLAIIYDWCYDRLGATRQASMVALMNAYFDDMRANAYQRNAPADGNYFTTDADRKVKHEGGLKALAAMESHLGGRDYLVGQHYSIADIALYAYTHVADEGGFDLEPYPAIRSWLANVAAQPGHVTIDA